MKIICESCRTKYSISDDKVRGKVFKIRCKKCNNVIVVKGSEGAGDGMMDPGMESLGGEHAGKPTMISDPSLEAAMLEGEGHPGSNTMISGGGGAEWHLAIGGEQVGPFTPEEVAQKFQAGEINGNTHVWKEGFSDWMLLSTVPDFAHLTEGQGGADNEATNLYSGTPKPAAADPFGEVSSSSADDLFGSAPAAQSNPASDPFGQDDPFGGDSASAASLAMPVQNSPTSSMTGARSESSVLFSLTNLQALALGSKDAKPQAASASQKAAPSTTSNTEGSGLIDIRSMSSALQFSKEKEKRAGNEAGDILFGVDSAAAFAGGMGSSVLLPAEQKSNTGLIVGAIIGGAVAVIGLVFALLFFLGVFDKKEPQPPVLAANTPTAEAPAPPSGGPAEEVKSEAGKETVGETGSGTEVAALSPSEEGKENKDTANSVRNDPKASAKPSKEPAAAPSKNETAAAPSTPPPPEPATPKETGGKKANADELDELLSGGSKSSGGGGSTASGPPTLTNAQIQAVMSRANVSSCKAIGTGKVSVKVTISSSGSVTNVSADGTPLGNCVAGVIRRLKFPSISSPSQTFPYPVFVR